MPTNRSDTRVVLSMKGDLQQEPLIQVKNGVLVHALNYNVTVAGVFDASLKWFAQLPLALATWLPVRALHRSTQICARVVRRW